MYLICRVFLEISETTNSVTANNANGNNSGYAKSCNLGKDHKFRIFNDFYNLKKEYADDLRYHNFWINNGIMDTAQNLLCKKLDSESTY